ANEIYNGFVNMSKTSNIQELTDLQRKTIDQLLELSKTSVANISAEHLVTSCQLGWGNLAQVKADLDSVSKYNVASENALKQPSRPTGPRPSVPVRKAAPH